MPAKRVVALIAFLIVILIAAGLHIDGIKKEQTRKEEQRQASILARRQKEAEAAAIKRKQEEKYNRDRLSTANTLADSGKFMMAYEIMVALPDTLIKEEDLAKLVEPAFRQSIQNFNAIGATKALSALPLDFERQSIYAQTVEALNKYIEASQRLDSIERIEKEKNDLNDLLEEDCLPLYRRGRITKKWSDQMYEANDKYGRLFIIITNYTEFTSTGSFSLPVNHLYNRPMELSNGFTKEVPVYMEDSDCSQMAQEILDWRRSGRREVREEKSLLKKEERESYKQLQRLAKSLNVSISVAD